MAGVVMCFPGLNSKSVAEHIVLVDGLAYESENQSLSESKRCP